MDMASFEASMCKAAEQGIPRSEIETTRRKFIAAQNADPVSDLMERYVKRVRPFGCDYCGKPYNKSEYDTCVHCGGWLPKVYAWFRGEPILASDIKRNAFWFHKLLMQSSDVVLVKRSDYGK